MNKKIIKSEKYVIIKVVNMAWRGWARLGLARRGAAGQGKVFSKGK